MGGAVTCMEERKESYRALVGKSEEKRSLGRPRYRWDDNIKMYPKEVGGWHVLN